MVWSVLALGLSLGQREKVLGFVVIGMELKIRYRLHSHRNALDIIDATPELTQLWQQLQDAITNVDDDSLLSDYQDRVEDALAGRKSAPKSLSHSINGLLDRYLVVRGWERQSALFNEKPYTAANEKRWRLDFSKATPLSDSSARRMQTTKGKTGIAVEVAFNHGEAIAWNLLKPVMASELNHIAKATDIGEGVGVIICATRSLKARGGFDSAVGEFEKILRYLDPMRNQLTTPTLIVGLEAPDSFNLRKKKGSGPSEIVFL